VRKALWVTVLALFLLSACDYKVYDVTIWRGWVSRLTDALHELHGGEDHAGRRED
jgi:hypothetical protein